MFWNRRPRVHCWELGWLLIEQQMRLTNSRLALELKIIDSRIADRERERLRAAGEEPGYGWGV